MHTAILVFLIALAVSTALMWDFLALWPNPQSCHEGQNYCAYFWTTQDWADGSYDKNVGGFLFPRSEFIEVNVQMSVDEPFDYRRNHSVLIISVSLPIPSRIRGEPITLWECAGFRLRHGQCYVADKMVARFSQSTSTTEVSAPLWFAVFAFAAYPTYRISVAPFSRRRRRRRGLCVGCGYDLRGNVSGVCSECGRVFELRSDPPTGERESESENASD